MTLDEDEIAKRRDRQKARLRRRAKEWRKVGGGTGYQVRYIDRCRSVPSALHEARGCRPLPVLAKLLSSFFFVLLPDAAASDVQRVVPMTSNQNG